MDKGTNTLKYAPQKSDIVCMNFSDREKGIM